MTSPTDTTFTAVLDTAGKSDFEKAFISSLNTAANTPADKILSSIGEHILIFGLKLLAAIFIYFTGAWLIRVFKKSLRRLFEKKKTEPAIETFTMSLVTAILWIALIVVTVGTLGVETTSLAALLAAGGVTIGMALSGTVQNFAGGLMILIFKPFKVGDFIEAQGYSGTVSEVNITSTKLLTRDNRVITLPNGPLHSGTIDNYSQEKFRRVDLTIGVEYGSDVDRVKTIILSLAEDDDRIIGVDAGAPADPFVALSSLSASSVDIAVKLWTRTPDYWDVYYSMTEKIYKALPADGIQFPFPQLSVHINDK